MKQMRGKANGRRGRGAFTLIELLVVIAIIAIVAGLLFPGMTAAMKAARKATAKTEIASIKTAIQSFYSEYGVLPVPAASQGTDYSANTEALSKQMIRVLTANETAGATLLNPRKIVFLEMRGSAATSQTDGTFFDPWQQQYLMMVDSDYDGKITRNGKTILARALVWSLGVPGENKEVNSYE